MVISIRGDRYWLWRAVGNEGEVLDFLVQRRRNAKVARTEEDIAAFEEHHPVGTKARLAFALLLCTGQRRTDIVRMGWQHISGRAGDPTTEDRH